MRVSTEQFTTPRIPKQARGLGSTPKAAADVGRFYFNSLDVPVRARVMHQDAAGMTLRQELPFLELNGKLRDEDGREGSLENVSVCVRNGVPSLVLDVRYDDGRRDATIPFLIESTRAMRATRGLLNRISSADDILPAPAIEPKAQRRDETLPYGVRTNDNPVEAPVIASPEEARVSSVPLAPRPRYRQRNGWWARMFRSFVALFR